MTRLQISDQYQAGQLQTHARPIAQTVAAAPAIEDNRWKALAGAFASGELLMDTRRKLQDSEDTQRASQFANSMTVAELGKNIKEGKMFASESPVFAATVQHIWGQNSQDALTRDLTSKLTTGELKFNSPAEADTYLTEARNTALAGGSDYARAGFDKGYTQLRDKLMGSVAQINDKQNVDQASNAAYDRLSNKLLAVSGADFKGTPKDAADSLLSEYHLLRHTQVLPAAAAKGALGEVITRASAGGKTGLLEALLNSELPDVGSVRSFLGEAKAQTLLAQSGNNFDKLQTQRVDEEKLPWMMASDTGELAVDKFTAWASDPANNKYVNSAFTHSILNRNMSALAHQQKAYEKAQVEGAAMASVTAAQQRVDAALSTGSLYTVQGTNTPSVLTASGNVADFSVSEYAQESLARSTAALPFDQQVLAWSHSGVTNPNWSAQLKAGLFNLSSLGVDAKGKPQGRLNDEGTKALELFRQLNNVSPDAAKDTVGEASYKRFADIDFLTHNGRKLEDAAAIATNAASGAIIGSDVSGLQKKVTARVDDLVSSPWYKSDTVMGWMGDNTAHNTAQVTGTLRRYADLLVRSGQYGDADEAVKAAFDYIKSPKVSTTINGTLYMRSELPTPPKGGTQEEWFDRFLTKVPKARAKELEFSENQVRLEYDPTAKSYRAMVAGVPLEDAEGNLMVYPKAKIQEWYATQNQLDVTDAAARGAAKQTSRTHKAYETRLMGEVAALQKADGRVMEKYGSSTYGGSALSARITSRAAYDRILRDGNQDKSLSELMKLYPAKK